MAPSQLLGKVEFPSQFVLYVLGQMWSAHLAVRVIAPGIYVSFSASSALEDPAKWLSTVVAISHE